MTLARYITCFFLITVFDCRPQNVRCLEMTELCHNECESYLGGLQNSEFDVRYNDTCKVERCFEGCNLWNNSPTSNCQMLCNGTYEYLRVKELYCMLGCNFAVNTYLKKIQDQIGIPPAPVLVAGSQTNMSVSIRWDKSLLNNVSYLIQWKYEALAGDWEYYQPLHPTKETMLKIEGLHPYTKYKFRVAWIILPEHDPIISQESVVISTLAYGVPLSVPTVSISAIDPTRILVSWLPPQFPNGPILSYTINLKDLSNGFIQVKDIPAQNEDRFYIFNNLRPDTSYVVSVLARNNMGEGPMDSANVTTPSSGFALKNGKTPYLVLGARNKVVKQGLDIIDEPNYIYQGDNDSVMIKGVALHVKQNEFFISDSKGFVYRGVLNETKQPVPIISPSSSIENPGVLSVDWLNEKLYLVEKSKISRCDLDGKNFEAVIIGLESQPCDLKVDPYNGYLYWVHKGTSKGALYKMDLSDLTSGPVSQNEAKAIFVDSQLLAFAVDHASLQLMLPKEAQNTMAAISLDGSEITDIRQNTQQPHFRGVRSLVVHHGLFYWTTGEEVLGEEYQGTENKYFHNSFIDLTANKPFVGLNVLHPDAQPYPVPLNPVRAVQAVFDQTKARLSWSPPKLLSGLGRGAWQKWHYEIWVADIANNLILHSSNITTNSYFIENLKESTKYSMKVRAFSPGGKGPWSEEFKGKTLQKGTTKGYPFMLWSAREGLLKSNMIGDVVEPLIDKTRFPRAHIIDLAWYEDLLFLNINTSHVFLYNMTERGSMLRVSGINNAVSIAVDWFGKKIYWSNPYQQVISRANLDGSQAELLPIPTVARELNVDSPSAYLYWTTMYSVECARLHGGDRQVYFQAGFFAGKQVLGLTMDTDNNKVYWMVRSQDGARLYRAAMANEASNIKDTVEEVGILQEEIIRGPLRYYSSRLFWLHEQHEVLITDMMGQNVASLHGVGLRNLKTLTVVDSKLHPYPDDLSKQALNVIPHQVQDSSILVDGTFGSFNITWLPVTNVNFGKVFYEIKADSQYGRNTMITEQPYYMYKNGHLLQPYTEITVALRAFTYWSSSRRIVKVVYSPMSVPSVPLRPRVFISHDKAALENSQPIIKAEFRWTKPEKANGIIDGYRVFCWTRDKNKAIPSCNATLFHPKKLAYVTKGLYPNTTYYFQVFAFTEIGDSPGSSIIEAQTGEETPVPRLLLVKADAVKVADIDTHEEHLVSMDIAHPIDITFLSQDNAVFWIDRKAGLMRSDLDGANKSQMYQLDSPASSLTVDWIGRFLYWSEVNDTAHSSSIWMLDLNQNSTPHRLLNSSGAISTIEVDPFSSTLLWTSYVDGNGCHLMTCNTDGSQMRRLFTTLSDATELSKRKKRNVENCNCPENMDVGRALTIDVSDRQNQEILWIDGVNGHIWASDIHGCKCRLVVNAEQLIDGGLPPTSLTVDKARIYWSNASMNRIFVLDKQPKSGTAVPALEKNIVKSEEVNGVQGIAALGSHLQPLPDMLCLSPLALRKQPSAIGRTSTSITLKMPSVSFHPDCDGISRPSVYYVIYYDKVNSNNLSACAYNLTGCMIMETYELKTTVSNLQPYTIYSFRITAKSHYSSYTHTPTKAINFFTEEGTPSEPRNVTLDVLSPENLKVRWLPPHHLNGPYVHYYVHWITLHPVENTMRQGVQTVFSNKTRSGKFQTTLSNLLPNQTYFISVRVYPAKMETFNESVKASATTLPLPNNLTIEEISSSGFQLLWFNTFDNVVNSTVNCREVFSTKWDVIPNKVTSNRSVAQYSFIKLHPKTRYLCQLHLIFESHREYFTYLWPRDDRFTFETLGDCPGLPGVPLLTNLRKDIYQVGWTPSEENGGRIIYYILQVSVVQEEAKQDDNNDFASETEWLTVYNGSESKWIVTGLSKKHEYLFRVYSRNEYGSSNYSFMTEPVNFVESVLGQNHEAISIIVPVAITIGILIGIAFFVMYKVVKKHKQAKLLQDSPHNIGTLDLELTTLRELPRNGNFIHQNNVLYAVGNHLIDEELAALPHISRDQIVLTKFLGSGAFGEVFEGFARDLLNDNDEDMKVAIKTLRKGATDQEKAEFLKEAQLMSNFKHEHILHLLGICLDNDPNFIILELMEGGDLLSYLRSNRPTAFESSPLAVQDLISICVDVAKGCKYLEEMHFVHRDLAARNCLVSSHDPATRVVKIGDFGLARDIYKNDYYRKEGEGLLPVRWMSPESLVDGVFTSQSDVWAFGVLLWEVMTLGQQPYPARTNLEVLHYVRGGGKLDKPDNCPDDMHQLMLKCWSYHPEVRPTFKYCLDQLQELKRKSADLPSTCVHNNNYIGRTDNGGVDNYGYNEDENCNSETVPIPVLERLRKANAGNAKERQRLIQNGSDNISISSDDPSHINRLQGDEEDRSFQVKRAASLDTKHLREMWPKQPFALDRDASHVTSSSSSSQEPHKYLELLADTDPPVPFVEDGYEIPISCNTDALPTTSANNVSPAPESISYSEVSKKGANGNTVTQPLINSKVSTEKEDPATDEIKSLATYNRAFSSPVVPSLCANQPTFNKLNRDPSNSGTTSSSSASDILQNINSVPCHISGHSYMNVIKKPWDQTNCSLQCPTSSGGLCGNCKHKHLPSLQTSTEFTSPRLSSIDSPLERSWC